MAKEEVYQHNFRLNLNNPQHLQIHRRLLHVNKDIYKSKNDYMIRKLYEGMFGEEGMKEKTSKELENRIVKNVLQELLKVILPMVNMQPTTMFGGITSMDVNVKNKEETTDKINEQVASAALGYFDDWSELDDE